MVKAFGIITAFLIALSAFLAIKNKQAYQGRIDETAVQKQNLAKSTERFNIAVENVNQTSDAIAKTEAETAELNKQSADRKKINDDLKLQSETKTAQVNSNKEKLDEVREKTAEVGNLRELATEMRQVTADLEELSQSITTAEAKLANLTSDNNQAESLATSIRTRLDTYTAGRSLPTLNTRIRSIYPTWGFVTLAAGNNAGVVTSSTLHVVRDDQVIARLLVTAVESTTSSASIIPDSLAQDVTLMVGDRVIAAPAPAAASN
jgi:uncharacterized phage infection (PIP) family protein YhgE